MFGRDCAVDMIQEGEQGLTLLLKGGVMSGIRYLLNSERSDDVREATPSSLARGKASNVHTASLTGWLCRIGRFFCGHMTPDYIILLITIVQYKYVSLLSFQERISYRVCMFCCLNSFLL